MQHSQQLTGVLEPDSDGQRTAHMASDAYDSVFQGMMLKARPQMSNLQLPGAV